MIADTAGWVLWLALTLALFGIALYLLTAVIDWWEDR